MAARAARSPRRSPTRTSSSAADGVPKLLAVVLGILSLLAAFQKEGLEIQAFSLRSLGVAGLGFACAAILPFTGYLLGAGLLAAASAFYYGARGRNVVIFSVLTAIFLWLIFARTLGVALP
ncbi:MAG: tripartite tricarboxylate transporter TctB family protein [Betaproteobacteria bacterium]